MSRLPDRRLADVLSRHKPAIVDHLADLEWAADPNRPEALVTGRGAVRARVEVFLECLLTGLRDDDWAPFDELIGARTEAVLRSGARSAADLNDRALVMTSYFIPLVLPEPDSEELVVALFRTMQNVSGRVIARHHAELLEESARLDDLKSMFLRLTTHELRAPLGTIRGYASMLESGDLGELSAPATQAIGAIASAAGVALSLIEQLVEVSRLDIGTEALHPAPVPLAELIADAAALVARDAEAAGIRLAIDSTSAAVECDRERLIVAVRNLLHNAVKYSPPRSKVTVTGTVAADAVIEVADEGGGIPESELPRLFDRYYRGAGVRGKPDGSGLGLYITKRIAELHGGDVEVSSTPGSGSRFRIRIPTRAA